MPRIFVALPVPLDVARSLAAALPDDLPGLRRVAPELMHVTLAFVGPLDEARVAGAVEAVRAAAPAARPFRCELAGLGLFPRSGPPRVAWAGIGPAAAKVQELGARVRAELLRAGIAFDAKPLSAHVTLARARDELEAAGARALAAAVRGARLPPGLAFDVDAVHVMESAVGRAGPRYSSRARIAFPADRAG